MIEFTLEKNPEPFLKRCGDFLNANKGEHNLILAICHAAAKKAARGEDTLAEFMTLSGEDGFIIAGVRHRDRNLVLSRATSAGFDALADQLSQRGMKFPAIVGPSDVASSVASRWSELTGIDFSEYMDQIIYAASEIFFPPQIDGELRPAEMKERDLISSWTQQFCKDALPKLEQIDDKAALDKTGERISAGSIYVWSVNGQAVAQTSVTAVDDFARISMVYTPPEHRGKGYASAVVAHASQYALDQGKNMCCLYADARNPVSNSIYRKIGYAFVGRSSMYVIDKK